MGSRKLVLASLLLLAGAGLAQAQTAGVVTLRANQTSATGSMTPTLTWSTNPTATSCAASGGWSGTKAANGSQTLASISATTTYTLTCQWGAGSATLSWRAPTTNTNGTPITNLKAYKVVYGTSSGSLNQSQMIDDNTRTTHTVNSLTPGTWYFAVRAVNMSNAESGNSNVGQKSVAAASAAESVRISITAPNPTPTPTPTGLRTYQTSVYDVSRPGGTGSYILGRVVGSIAVGRPCQSSYRVPGTDYYRVYRQDVTFSRTSRSNVVMARCRV